MDGSYCVKPLKQKQVVNIPASRLPSFQLLCLTFERQNIYFPSNILHRSLETRCLYCSSSCSFLSHSGGWSELPAAGDIRDREQIQQPGIKGKIPHPLKKKQKYLKWYKEISIFFLFSPCRFLKMRSVTTVRSVLCVCLMCETLSSCHADIYVSATPAQTRCATRPTAVPSAGCVSFLLRFLWKDCHCFN